MLDRTAGDKNNYAIILETKTHPCQNKYSYYALVSLFIKLTNLCLLYWGFRKTHQAAVLSILDWKSPVKAVIQFVSSLTFDDKLCEMTAVIGVFHTETD
jgi:hypothetical protein